MNIVEPIFAQCKNKPAELALSAPGTDFNLVSYGRLERCVNNICRRILSLGITAGNRVAVFIDDPIFHAMLLIALMKVGVVTISGRRKNFSWSFGIDAVIAEQPYEFPAGRTILAERNWIDGSDQPFQQIHGSGPDDLCRIFLTYGVSGEEKAIAVTSRMMAARIEHQKWFFGPQAPFCDRTYLDLALTTSLGFQVLLATLWRGGALVMPGDFEKTIEALPFYKVQNMVSSASGLLNFVEAIEQRPGYRCHLEAVFCGGAISESFAEKIRERICCNLTVGHVSTDATMVASMPAQHASKSVGSVGYVLPGVMVEIVDDDGCPLLAGQAGKVRIRAEYGASGFLDDPLETQRLYKDGWRQSGEIGRVTDDNMLVISRWPVALLQLGDEVLNPALIEETLLMHINVVECCVLAVANEAGIGELCALIVPRSYLDFESLRQFCEARLPALLVPTRFIAVADLPKDANGRIDRTAIPKLVKTQSRKVQENSSERV
jgi:acyl-CoA synthetase (AMP-forming)/AMP-acid ligase II